MNDRYLTALVFSLVFLNLAFWLLRPDGGRRWLRLALTRFRSLPKSAGFLLLVLLAVCTLRGGSKSNLLQNAAAPASTNLVAGACASALLSDTSRTASGLTPAGGAAALSGGPAYLSEAQCAAGFALVCVTNAGPAWLSAPPGAATNALWARRGAAEDAFWLPAEGWSFMLGTNAAEGLYVSSCGALSFSRAESLPGARALPDGTAGGLLAPLLAPLGIAPSRGRFWHAATPSNSLLLTWQDVYAGRDAAAPVTAQAELFWNGDFTFRYAFPSNLPAAFTNFVAGAQHNGGGQTYALGEPGLMADGLELRWRAFGWLDPALSDHDGDGLASYDEVMLLGTDPRKTDTDGDGLSDAAETASGSATSPADPDTDGDGLADGLDARPSVWDDLSADPDGDGLDLLHERLYGLDPAVSDSADSDYDGWADWQELLAGTDPANGQASPSRTDGSDILFDATVTLAADLPSPAVLTVGPHRLVLFKAGSWTLTLKEGVAHAVTLLSARPCAAALSLSFAKGYAALLDPSGIFSGAFASDGRSAASALVAQPSVQISADPVCFHSDSPKSVSAEILPAELGGAVTWSWPRGSLSAPHSKTTEITWDGEPGQSGIRVSFLATGAAAAREASAAVSRCTLTDAHPGSGDDAWSQENTLWTAEGATTGNPSDPGPGKACAAPGTAVAVNDDDDDADGVRDLDDTDGVAQDGDLRAAWPFTPYAGGCCLCAAHNPELPESASLVSCSGNLAVYADGSKTVPATAAGKGLAVYLEGRGASVAVGADRLVWEWTDNGALRRQTNAYTVLGVRLTGDFNLDGAADAADRALLPSLTNAWGWAMPAATGVCRKVNLRTDVGVAGDLWLRFAGDAGAFRIWTTPSPSATNPPLLACGQTVTNGAGGESFLTGADTLLYVEAVSNGTAKLTYGFTGTGEAEGLRCAAALGMTAILPKIEVLAGGALSTNLLQVAKWESAFSNGLVQVPGGTVTNAVFAQTEFIGTDVDRIRIRVNDARRMEAASVEVVLQTDHPSDSTYDAAPRSLVLSRVSPGVFLSTNLLLVSDWNDATFDATAYGVASDSTNRIFSSQLGSRLQANYVGGGGQTNGAEALVGVGVKTVGVDVAIMRTNGVACIDTLTAMAQVTLAKERFAQANVAVEMGDLVYFDAPTQVNVELWYVMATNNTRMLSPEARYVVHEAVSAVTNGDNNVCLIFVPSVRSVPAIEIAGHATASYWYVYPLDVPYTDHCLISVGKITPFVSTHEMCHALGVQPHESKKCNLMFPAAVPYTDVSSSKRLTNSQLIPLRSGVHVQ